MRKTLPTLLALALALSALPARAQTGDPGITANGVIGEVAAADANAKQLFVKTDAGSVVIVTVADNTLIKSLPPGETTLTKAADMPFAQLAAGDRVFARGAVSADRKSVMARMLIVNTKAELEKKREADRAEWQARGVVGVVSAVNPETKEITINTRTPEGPKPVVINAGGPAVKLRRYAPDSIKFADAKPSTFEEVKAGDQLRAKGEKSADGSKFTAEEVVTGSFRTTLGTVKAVDTAKNEITVEQADKKTLTVVVRPDSVLKQVPAEMATMMGGGGPGGPGGAPGAGGQPPAGGGQRVVIQQGGPGGGAPPAGGQGGPGGPVRRTLDPQQMLERLPAVTLADLKPGQMIVVSSTVGADPTRVTAIQLVSNVEPLVAMMSRRPGGGGGGGGGGAGGGAAAAGSAFNFGFGIGTP
jgi:ribosomal protein L24